MSHPYWCCNIVRQLRKLQWFLSCGERLNARAEEKAMQQGRYATSWASGVFVCIIWIQDKYKKCFKRHIYACDSLESAYLRSSGKTYIFQNEMLRKTDSNTFFKLRIQWLFITGHCCDHLSWFQLHWFYVQVGTADIL